MPAADRFGGASARSVWENLWPFSRATLEITADAITRTTPSGRCTALRLSDNRTVAIVRYLYLPFCVRTIVWIDRPSRAGFTPYRWRAVRDSLRAHGWQVDLQTKSWRTVIPDARRSWRSYIDTGEFPPP